MHVHMSPSVQPQGPAALAPKPVRPASAGADLHALTALSKDRDGSGSRQRRDARQPRDEPQAAVATAPAATLAALLVTLDLDAHAGNGDAGGSTPVAADLTPESPLERFLRGAG